MFGAVAISFYVVLKNWKAYNRKNLEAIDDWQFIDKWAPELPREVLEMIVKRLMLPDYVRFGAVCWGWRLVEKERRHPPMPQLPWLMLNNANRSLHILEFYSLSEDRVYSIELPSFGVCTTAYEGWLMIHKLHLIPGLENQSFLFNPFSGDQIYLPKLEIDTVRTEGCFLDNAVLSAAPSTADFMASNDCFVAGIYRNGGFWVCELGHYPTAAKLIILPPVDRDPEYFLKGVCVSLVVSGGDLLLVSRIGKFALHHPTIADWFYVPPKTKRFEIFKLDWDISHWVEVESLDVETMFFFSPSNGIAEQKPGDDIRIFVQNSIFCTFEETALHEFLYIAYSCNPAGHQAPRHKKIDREREKGRMKNLSFLASLLIVLVLLVSQRLEAEAQVCRPSGKIRGRKPPPGECNQENDSDCCVEGKLYTTYKCSPQVSAHTKAVLTLNSFQKGGDGGGPSECDKQYHSDDIPVVALSTGWYNRGGRCLSNITISANGRSVNAMVVDECSSTMGCDADHDYQPPCSNNIVDASKAVWEALGVPRDNWGGLDITWSDA
ncbi:hypothetical protein F0562_014875 [Nyssa sinensis]|uniref:Uncharacterized protein n=1 Tax=Nyssa sinensis TaxID=561372 RepID=A0A5J4ZRG8_9ASTE|nr:hypothetical protein F0562_014875 [Nyssa sinensis]